MMIKVLDAGSQSFDDPVAQLVKLSSRGLIGADRGQFIKRAGEKFAYELDQILPKLPPDEPLLHLLAVGATEDYGCNRNGDGFRRITCQNYHPTFVKYARFYRGHKNKDPRISYGLVKASAYNDRMRRIELLVSLNGSKEAALRNGGLLADKEMEKLAAGKDIAVSMACKIPYDICSYCGNKAPGVEDYCVGVEQGGRCKAGGLRDHMGALVEIDGGVHQLHADNDRPTFFDISDVFRPADRIAYVSGRLKAASAAAGGCISGAQLARALGVTLPIDLAIDSNQPANVKQLLKIAYCLADREQELQTNKPDRGQLLACSPAVQTAELNPPPFTREKFSLALRALADQHVLLPPARFIELTTDSSREKAAEINAVVSQALPGVYNRLLADGGLADRLAKSPYTPDVRQAPQPFAVWAEKLAGDYSLRDRHVSRRAATGVIRNVSVPSLQSASEKEAAASPQACRLAEEYALYTMGFLSAIQQTNPDSPLTETMAVLQTTVTS